MMQMIITSVSQCLALTYGLVMLFALMLYALTYLNHLLSSPLIMSCTLTFRDLRISFLTKMDELTEIGRFGWKSEIHTFWRKADEIFEICNEKLFSIMYECQILYILQSRLINIIRESKYYFTLFKFSRISGTTKCHTAKTTWISNHLITLTTRLAWRLS